MRGTGALQTGSPPLTGSANVPSSNGTGTDSISVFATGKTDLSTGRLFSQVRTFSTGAPAEFAGLQLGEAVATMEFSVNPSFSAAEISLNCNLSNENHGALSLASLTDVTTSQSLFQCVLNHIGNISDDSLQDSATVFLNTRDTYVLNTFSSINNPDIGSANLTFHLTPVPEPSTFCLLGMDLIALGLVRKRLEKGPGTNYRP
jgi:hypothetical protein